MPEGDLSAELLTLAKLKEEHEPLLAMIQADGGMKPETRRVLVEHIYEEEEERLQKIAALRGTGAAAPVPEPAAASGRRGLTVGSLMMVQTHTAVGSLRPPSRPLRASPGLTVGSLRPY